MRIYRALLRLYPRRFRLEYQDDMVVLVKEQLRDEPVPRVVARAVLDLLVTVPTSHLEAHVRSSTTTPLVIACAVIAMALTGFGGPIGVGAAVALLALAALVWRRGRPVAEIRDPRWWKLLLGGVGLLATLVVVTTITGELPSGGVWYLAMATMLVAFGLIASGAVLGIAGRSRSLPAS